MKKILLYIQRKPKSVRDSYALGIASTFTILVILVWVVARPSEESLFGNNLSKGDGSSPFSTLIDESKEQFSLMKESVKAVTEGDQEAQVAQVTSASTSPSEMILSTEDIDKARQDLEKSSSTESMPQKGTYSEVLIGTTSASVAASTTAQ